MDKDMKSSTQTTEPEQQSNDTVDQQQVSSSRRRFAKAVAGSGVVLSLASKPVMGSNYWCTGSGGMSGNTSSHGPKRSCLACSPGYWKSSPGAWPAPYYPYQICKCSGMTLSVIHGATTFLAAFGSGPNDTMMSILKTQNGTRNWHAICALLNAAKAAAIGLASAYTVFEIKQMYASGAPASTFSSTYDEATGMHNCPLPNDNGSVYLAENLQFCKIIDHNGDETSTANHC